MLMSCNLVKAHGINIKRRCNIWKDVARKRLNLKISYVQQYISCDDIHAIYVDFDRRNRMRWVAPPDSFCSNRKFVAK